MFFKFRSKPKKVPFYPHPPGWPSPLHNKCSNPLCRYPNPPQAAEGRYDCNGVNSGFYCEGVYHVSTVQVEAVMRKHRDDCRREADARYREEQLEATRLRELKQEEEDMRNGIPKSPSRYESERRYRVHDHMSNSSIYDVPILPPQAPLERRSAQRKQQVAEPPLYGPGTFEHPRPSPRALPMRPQQSYQSAMPQSQNHNRYVSDGPYPSRHAAQPPHREHHASSRHGRSRAQSRPEVPPRGWI